MWWDRDKNGILYTKEAQEFQWGPLRLTVSSGQKFTVTIPKWLKEGPLGPITKFLIDERWYRAVLAHDVLSDQVLKIHLPMSSGIFYQIAREDGIEAWRVVLVWAILSIYRCRCN